MLSVMLSCAWLTGAKKSLHLPKEMQASLPESRSRRVMSEPVTKRQKSYCTGYYSRTGPVAVVQEERLKHMSSYTISEDEVELSAVRAQGSGGQNVNKLATAIHLRFDIGASGLPAQLKERLLNSRDQRINSDGVVVIKAQGFRTQARNRQDALKRLQGLIDQAAHVEKPRRPTRPPRAAKRRRLDAKSRKGKLKSLRGKPSSND